MSRIIALAALALAPLALAAPALAQHGEEEAPAEHERGAPHGMLDETEGGHAEHGAHAGHGGAEGGHAEHPIGLDSSAINWADFNYLSTAEEYEAEHHIAPGPPVLAQLINFLILAIIIYYLGRKPLTAYLQSRSDKVRQGLVEAQKLLEEANEKLADYSARLERMDDEMTRLREEFIAAGVAERDRLVADAGAKAERMKRDAEVRLQQEFAQLREELRVELVEKALATAREALEKKVTDADHRRLADDYVGRIEQEGLGQ